MSKEKQKEWYQANKERIKAERKEYYQKNIDKIKQYREENKEKIYESNRLYYQKNNEIINSKRTVKWKEKYDNDPLFKIKHNVRTGIQRFLKKTNLHKISKTEILLGCTFEEFKQYLESKFEPWMTWDNYGLYNSELNYGWDIDHIIPVSTAMSIEDITKLSHYSNLQPLCSYVNRVIKRESFSY